MRIHIIALSILIALTITAFQTDSDEYRRIRLSTGIKTEIPADWVIADTTLTSVTYTNPSGDAHYIFNARYEAGYTNYESYDEYSEETKADVLETSPNVLRENRPEFTFEILEKEFTKIGGKPIYHIRHRAVLKPEYSNNEDYANYPGMFCEDIYVYLKWGYFYSYQIYRESDISEEEIEIAEHIVKHLELYK